MADDNMMDRDEEMLNELREQDSDRTESDTDESV